MKISVPDNLVALGTVVELVVEKDGRREVLSPPSKREQWLCGDATKEALWLLPKRTAPGPLPEGYEVELRRMAAVYRLWNDFEPRRTQLTPALAVRGPWRTLGRAIRILYRSDKWGDGPQQYEHDFDRARVLRLGPLHRIAGGLKVTARGIVG